MPETNRDEIAKLETLYASNPEGRVFTHLAEAYRKAGEYDRARAILEQGLGKHPGYASAYVVLGRVFFDLNDMSQATDSFRRVLELDPHNLVALRSLGDIERGAGNRDQALEYFQELRHLDPSNAEIEGIIAELRSAPAQSAAVEPVEAAAESFEGEPQIETFESAAEASYAAPAETTFDAAPFEPAAEPAAEDFPLAEMDFETPSVAENLPEFDVPAPDISELISPDMGMDWGAQEPAEEQALPGDLAGFADLMVTSTAHDAFDTEPVADLPLLEPEESALPDWPAEEEPAAAETTSPFETTASNAEVVTETMARLYRDQGLFERSAEIYRALLKDRPGDWSLQAGLQEVESLASAGSAPSEPAADAPVDSAPEARPSHFESSVEEEPSPFMPTAPEAALEPMAAFEPEPDAEPASPWVDPTPGTPPEAPGLYSWEEAAKDEPQQGAPIGNYFKSLLSWRPHGNGAQSSFAPAPEVEEEPAYLELDLPGDTAQDPYFEEPVMALEPERQPEEAPAPPAGVPQPPATAPDEIMPWEEPASPSMPDAPVIPMPPATPGAPVMPVTPPAPLSASGNNPVDAAFDEWFNTASSSQPLVDPLPPPVAQSADLPPAHQPATPSADVSETGRGDSEDDDDLEMFRSWLQSLKK